jgi:dGTP triphosphohydrolase
MKNNFLNCAEHLQAVDSMAKRLNNNSPHQYRNNYQRDRDRILYTASFRRLVGKTQIFNVGGDDNFRNRITHTLEVIQIATTISKALGLNVPFLLPETLLKSLRNVLKVIKKKQKILRIM